MKVAVGRSELGDSAVGAVVDAALAAFRVDQHAQAPGAVVLVAPGVAQHVDDFAQAPAAVAVLHPAPGGIVHRAQLRARALVPQHLVAEGIEHAADVLAFVAEAHGHRVAVTVGLDAPVGVVVDEVAGAVLPAVASGSGADEVAGVEDEDAGSLRS